MTTADDAITAGALAICEDNPLARWDEHSSAIVVRASWAILTAGLRHHMDGDRETGLEWCVQCSNALPFGYGDAVVDWPCERMREILRIDEELGLWGTQE